MSAAKDLLDVSENRFTLHPIKYPSVFQMGKDAIDSFWKVEELDFSNDRREFANDGRRAGIY